MSDQFISRNEIHKETIASTNKEIEILKVQTQNNRYLTSITDSLNTIDKEHFSAVLAEINQTLQLVNFYIENDNSKKIINPENQQILEDYLNILVKSEQVNESDLNNFLKAKTEGKISQDVLTSLSLQNLLDRMKMITEERSHRLEEWSRQNIHDRTIASNPFADSRTLENLIEKNKDVEIATLVKETKAQMHDRVSRLNNEKNKYKIKYKWFLILVPILFIGMILALALPFIF
ncbi:hypothetical protein [Williamsoniiplasma lucivorax]|uniref:Uncharacterized protein n=1 Tax=Williamsoniiplasma lucivorax TaxID=209274 RepID=A0A2S5RD92_9MOLU|nr:hypothetical protein [Williamsoniiplasma lucivorax]PPE05264.1 hypothetical protein ELUCI_v1c08000 [Williamsoniiplasma lucivorax]